MYAQTDKENLPQSIDVHRTKPQTMVNNTTATDRTIQKETEDRVWTAWERWPFIWTSHGFIQVHACLYLKHYKKLCVAMISILTEAHQWSACIPFCWVHTNTCWMTWWTSCPQHRKKNLQQGSANSTHLDYQQSLAKVSADTTSCFMAATLNSLLKWHHGNTLMKSSRKCGWRQMYVNSNNFHTIIQHYSHELYFLRSSG